MVKYLWDVHPEGWADLNANTMNTKAGKDGVQPVPLQGAKRFLIYRLLWIEIAPIVNKHGQKNGCMCVCAIC